MSYKQTPEQREAAANNIDETLADENPTQLLVEELVKEQQVREGLGPGQDSDSLGYKQ